MANPNWKKGVSGNPSGRPVKNRALSETLRARGRASVIDIDGKKRSGNAVVARAMWELATTGRTRLPGNDDDYTVGVQGWFEIAKWIYGQVDGPPKSEHDITTGGESLNAIGETRERLLETVAKIRTDGGEE